VLELSGNVDVAALTAAELVPLGGEQGKMVVAFADDPQLHAFLERVDAYRAAGDDADTAQYEGLIDAIDSLRPYGPDDRLTPRVQESAQGLSDGDRLDLHLDLWHPGDPELATAWLDELDAAIRSAGGEVLDRYSNHVSGLLLARAAVPAAALPQVAQLDQVAVVDGLPTQPPSNAIARRVSVEDLPRVEPPSTESPIVGLIDSGVQSAHPLLAGAVYDATTLSGELPGGEDEHGHGTRVAGLLLHGSLRDALARGLLPAPMFRLLSVRVLGADNCFPHGTLWEAELERAIRYCVQQGARVVNLSLGDPDTPYVGPRSTPVAALLDQLTRELDVVLVLPTGNTAPVSYAALDETLPRAYVRQLLENTHTSMLDPAPAITALTVGGLAADTLAGTGRSTGSATRRALGEAGWPAPISRIGPGIAGAIKPDLVAPAGSLAWEAAQRTVVSDEELGVLSSGGEAPDRLLDSDIGTSYAAPLVARTAGGVLARYPDISANLARALVLLGARDSVDERAFSHLQGAELFTAKLRTCGYGVPDLGRTIDSSSHRAVLVADGEIELDTTIVYEVPIPASFRDSGGQRGIDVALAFDPPTRARRLDYAANRMQFWLVRRMGIEEIEAVFIRGDPSELEGALAAAEDSSTDEPEQPEASPGPPKPSELGPKLVQLIPKAQARSRGANQLGRKVFSHRLTEADGDTFHLVVQSRSLWRGVSGTQKFGLAVALWRTEGQPEIYNEIRARVEVEVPVEIEVRR
jgi:hypothetical protein